MMEDTYDALRAAVTLAKNENITKVAVLKQRLMQHGFPEGAVKAALGYWAASLRDNIEAY